MKLTPNPRFDTDPSQRRFAPLFRAGQAKRSASCGSAGSRRVAGMQAIVADPVVADAAKDPVVVRGYAPREQVGSSKPDSPAPARHQAGRLARRRRITEG